MSSFAADGRRLQQLRKLTEVSRALTYALSLSEILDLTVAHAAELLETPRVLLLLVNEDGMLTIRAGIGFAKDATAPFREPLDETLVRRLEVLLDVGTERFFAVPLVAGGEVTGLLAVTLAVDRVTSEDDEWLLSALADQAAVALEKSRLDQTAEFRERLIGIVSHDLRNPIGAILMGTQMLLGRDHLDATTTKGVSRIHSRAERAVRMIRDLLDFTQARLGGGIEIRTEPTDLRTIANQVVEEASITHASRRIVLRASGDASGAWDGDRIAQVLGNLLTNAVTYSTPDTPVNVVIHGERSDVVLAVHNEGPPIPLDVRARIFEPMQRASEQMSSASRSVGLGLYIVRNIVTAHGGTIGIESTEEAGTTFTVRLPRRVAAA